jgi:hypothetical protein
VHFKKSICITRKNQLQKAVMNFFGIATLKNAPYCASAAVFPGNLYYYTYMRALGGGGWGVHPLPLLWTQKMAVKKPKRAEKSRKEPKSDKRA